MYIIMLETFADGGRPALQTWDRPNLPNGYAWCPDEFFDVFYSTNPSGFVHITVENDTVTAMEVNWDAYNKYVEENPDVPEPVEPETEDVTWDSMAVAIMEGVDEV